MQLEPSFDHEIDMPGGEQSIIIAIAPHPVRRLVFAASAMKCPAL